MIDLTGLVLSRGAHSCESVEICFEEASSILKCALDDPTPATTWPEALERFRSCKTDHPPGDSPVVAAIMRSLNDWMDDDERRALVAYGLRVAGCRGTAAVERRREWLVVDRAIRSDTADICEALGLGADASALRGLAPLDGRAPLRKSVPVLEAARARARARALTLDHALARDLARDHDLARARTLTLDLDHALDLARDLARALTLTLDLALDLARARALTLDHARALTLDRSQQIRRRLDLVDALLAVTA